MPSGGPRTPRNPAPVSGPGPMSRRTDGGPGQPIRDPGDLPYGENQELRNVQSSAPMSNSNATAATRATSGARGSVGAVTPFGAPSERPNEPVTTGNPLGDGPGPSVLASSITTPQQMSMDGQQLKKYLPQLLDTANAPGVPEGFVRFVRYLRSL